MRGRHLILALPLLVGLASPPRASADVSVHIGIHVSTYPDLQPVPGYPVYYAPGLPSNYFFYDGLYWVFVNDTWYSSSWYNGPWYVVEPVAVPVYVLRVPVRYYRVPPPYFRSWAPAEPPRWGAYWGPQWEARHRGWNQWDRRTAPPPAPLPVYQRQYLGDRYPSREQQQVIRQQQYRFEPRDEKARERLAVEARAQPTAPPARAAAGERATQAQEQRQAREREAQQQQRRQARQHDERERQQRQDARQRQQQAQQAREREQDQARQQQQQQARQQQLEQQARRQREQAARQHQEQARQAQEQRVQQAHQQQRQQQQTQERQRQAREQQQEQAERRAQRPHTPGRERRDGD